MGTQLSADLCEAVGINPKDCSKAVILCTPEGVTVRATLYVRKINGDPLVKDGKIARRIKKYKLVEDK